MNIEKELWDLSNAITGFVVVQAIAFLVTIGTSTTLKEELIKNKNYFHWGVIIASALYIVCIVLIWMLLPDNIENKGIWRITTAIRICLIIFVQAAVFYIIRIAKPIKLNEKMGE